MKTIFKMLISIILLLLVVFVILQKSDIPLEALKGKYCNDASKFIEMDGMNVHYKIEGEGNPIVLIHGTGSVLQTWDEWTDSLVRHNYKVIRLDMPGFGITGPRKDNDYSIKMYVNFLDKFMQKIGIDTFALSGNSLGGEIAWCYAATFPQKVKELILVDPSGFYAKDKKNGAIVFKLARIKWMAALMSKIDTKMIVEKTVKDVYEDDSKIKPSTVQMYYDMSLRAGNRASFSARVQQIGKEVLPPVSAIHSPTLIMWGKQDKLIDISMAEHFKAIPNSTLIVYEGVGHSPQEEIPAKSVSDVLSFMKK